MKITIWDILRYLFKWKLLIIGVVILSLLLAVVYTDKAQSYESQIVLQYTDDNIKSGLSPNGEKFDPYEIVSPDIITAVINDLSLRKSVDDIRSKVTINSVIPDSEKEKEEEMLKQGKEYTYYPTTFSITYSGSAGDSQGEVRDILDSIVQNYLDFYISNYVREASINDATFDEDIGDYDYIEIAELISGRIDTIINSLDRYYAQNSSFRSPVTGMTFPDLTNEYQHIQEFTMSKIFSNIYRGQITKDKDLLLKKYTQRMEDYQLEHEHYQGQADLTRSRMDKFAEANKDVPNSYNQNTDSNDDGLEIIQDIYGYTTGDDENAQTYNTTTTYDGLISTFVSEAVTAGTNQLDAEHCQEVIDRFSVPLDPSIDTEALTEEIIEDLNDTKTKMADIYKTLNLTVEDYNAANATKYIKLLTGVQYYSTKSVSLYALILVVCGLLISIVGVIAHEILRAAKKAGIALDDDEDEETEEEEAETV